MRMLNADAHWRSCTGSDADLGAWTGRHGDAMQTCAACGRVSVVAEDAEELGDGAEAEAVAVQPAAAAVLDEDLLEPASAPVSVLVPSTSRWRCRLHPDQAVTWRGRGCPECGVGR